MSFKVLITTSGIGSRLGELTRYTNKSLVRVGDKPIISHIIDNYPDDTEFVVTLGHFGKHVKEFLEVAYPDRVINFVTVKNYAGMGSSLGISMFEAQDFLQEPFIFNAGDTIFAERSFIPEPDVNWVAGSEGKDASEYTSFDTSAEFVSKFHPKGMIGFDYVYIGLAGIYDYKIFWQNLKILLENKPEYDSVSDVNVFERMKNLDFQIKYHVMNNWIDTGNVRSLENARSAHLPKYEVLEKGNEAVFFVNNSVIKFFGDAEIVKKRIKRAEVLDGLVPRIQNSKTHFFSYEFQSGTELSKLVSENEIYELLNWAEVQLWTEPKIKLSEDFQKRCLDFYKEKTLSRVKSFLNKNEISDSENKINKANVPSIFEIMSHVDFEILSAGTPSGFHGDFILDNILKTNSGYILLDWRQDFGGETLSGDRYYDISKLNHSLIINHEIVTQGKFEVLEHKGEIRCDIFRKQSFVESQNALHNFLNHNGWDRRKVNILTAIIWLNMATLHHHPFDQFLFYYGKYSLWKALQSDF